MVFVWGIGMDNCHHCSRRCHLQTGRDGLLNDLTMDTGTAQYPGSGVRGQDPLPLASLPTPTDGGGGTNGTGSSTNGYQWREVPHYVLHEPRQTIPPFGYPQPGQPSYGVAGHIPAQQMDTDFKGQRPRRSPHVYVCCSRPPRPFKRSPKLVGNIHSIRVTLGLANYDVPVGRGYIRLWVSIPCDGPEIS
jgi:hypothetical protein